MKRTTAILLCIAIILPAFSALFAVTIVISNPFEKLDNSRNESIENGLSSTLSLSGIEDSKKDGGCIVKFKATAALDDIYNCIKSFDYRLLAKSEERILWVNADASVLKAENQAIVENAEPQHTLTLSATANDPLAFSQWELDYIQAYRAWDITRGEREVTVAILDSGIYRAHPDFENMSILAGYDAVTRREGVSDDINGHGTKIASIIAAGANNGIGMAGIASNVSILPIRVSDEVGYIHSSDFIEAVYYAADSGADIINMSFGGYTYSSMEELAIQYADSMGCVMVSAAGNNEMQSQYSGMKAYPASYTCVISVGAIDENGELCPFSQRNSSVDLVAPGKNITVANTNGSYEKEQGTSFASAYVSGIAALCLSAIDKGITFSSDQFLSLIAKINGNSTEDGYGYGSIKAYSALAEINTPLVSGVADGGVYHKNVTITYNRGKAFLDGKAFESGHAVITSGTHNLDIIDGRRRISIYFITDNIPLQYEYKQTTTSASFSFTRGTATLDGVPYLSGSPITTSGKHYFKLTGPYGNTKSYEFECTFKAPQVFGVVNGGVYNEPVYINAGDGGVLTLNGAVIPNNKVISKSGSYSLVSSTADGNDSATIYFTVLLPNVNVYNSAMVSSKIIVDDDYNYLILYNDVLSGVRVFSKNDLSRTKCFIRTNSAVIGNGVCQENLILLHNNGISICNRKDISDGTLAFPLYYSFEKPATSSVVLDGYVYYTYQIGAESKLLRMDISNGKSTVLTSFSENIDYLVSDGKQLAAATKAGVVIVLDQNSRQLLKISTGNTIGSLLISQDYVCTDNSVYSKLSGKKLFSLNQGETLVNVYGDVLITDYSVYDLNSMRILASFSERVFDIRYGANGIIYKSVDGMRLVTVNNSNLSLTVDTAAKMLNAAAIPLLETGSIHELSLYESYVALPGSLIINDAVVFNEKKVIFAISSASRTLYKIDCNSLKVVSQISLRFVPSDICCSEDKVFISFSDENSIYVYTPANSKEEYFSCNDKYTTIQYQGQQLYALNSKGDVYALSAVNFNKSTTVIKSQNVIDFVCYSNYIYAYLKPVTMPMIYKIDCTSLNIEAAAQVSGASDKLCISNGKLFFNNKAFYADNLGLAYTLSDTVEAAYRNYVLTSSGLYFASNGKLIGDTKVSASLPLFDSAYNYYSFEKGRLCKIRNVRSDLHSLPEISGIQQGETLKGGVSATFDFGEAFLDGIAYAAGTAIENGGMHNLVVVLPFGLSKSIQFVIEAQINSISLSVEKYSIHVNEITKLQVTARPYTYGIVDVSYTTDNNNVQVLPDGSIIGAAEGVSRITATTSDGLHSATVIVTVLQGALHFDSSYFYADSANRIVRGIAPGTDIETFFAASANTHGAVYIRGYNGVTVSAGMIHTGMKAELCDIFGNVIDSWLLCVTGDIDEDGYITANDYYVLETLLNSGSKTSDAVYAAADIDGNGVVNAFDMLALKEHLLGNPFVSTDNYVPTHPVNTELHILMPNTLAAGTSFTLGLTLTEMKSISAISGFLSFDKTLVRPTSVRVYGSKSDGHHTITEDNIHFFADCTADILTNVVVTAVFDVLQDIPNGTEIPISCKQLWIYDGAAAFISDTEQKATISSVPDAEIKIFNLPHFDFDSSVTEYRLQFPADTTSIQLAAYPKAMCDIVGNATFSADNKASFSVVVNDGDYTTQYNFMCERDEGASNNPVKDDIYKSSNSNLSELKINGATLSPQFDKTVTSYYVLCDSPESLVVTATPEFISARVSVAPYNKSDHSITVTCTAEDGSISTYSLLIYDRLPLYYNNENIFSVWHKALGIITVILLAAPLILFSVFCFKKSNNNNNNKK